MSAEPEPKSAEGAPEEPGGTPSDVLAAIEALEALVADPRRVLALDAETLNRLRRAAGRVALPSRTDRRKHNRLRRQIKRDDERRREDEVLATTSNRALKRALRFPVAPPDADVDAEARRLLELQAPDAGPRPAADATQAAERGETPVLDEPRSCYVCKEPYTEVHHHYDQMCPACADLNWLKRHQSADLTGRVAIVTGSRVKIGFEAVLMLLRAGARVIATTRFPCDAARRFAAAEGFEEWGERLEVHGLDLRHTPSIETFTSKMRAELPRLDFLIHNACQTVRRPPDYYRDMLTRERAAELKPAEHALVRAWSAAFGPALGEGTTEDGDGALVEGPNEHVADPRAIGLTHAAELSGLDLLGEGDLSRLFPKDIVDGEGQQLDLRAENSWRMNLADVPTVEMIEVQLVNQIAPFVLTAQLKPLMLATAERDKHVVNVSAMEGQFYRALKTTRHPHTNMAKAALNMMTRTSAQEFAVDGIHMNSVDTGWVTDEDPFERTVAKEAEHRFIPPLDSIDGAARVVDPIFTGFLTGTHCWGQFLKDYRPTSW